jgi:hypothetical protein
MSKITELPSQNLNKTANKIVYLLKIEDHIGKAKYRHFVTSKMQQFPHGVEIIGYEISSSSVAKVESHTTAVEAVNESKEQKLVQMTFPWDRIVYINNVSYRIKNSENKNKNKNVIIHRSE